MHDRLPEGMYVGNGRLEATEVQVASKTPGRLAEVVVDEGDKVTKGQALAVMEAMKMEHTIAAPQDGVVAELLYAPGDQVTEGSELLKLAAA